MGTGDLKGWFSELALLENPVRREFHLFMLLSGSRPTALQAIKPNHIDFRRRTLHVTKPKGGSKRAFDIPLSREMILCLARAIRFGGEMYPLQAREWVFPAEANQGISPKQKKIEANSPSGAMIFGKPSGPSRRLQVFPRSTPNS